MNLPDNIIEHIKDRAEKLKHGRIVIEINESSNKLDVITEDRERFVSPGLYRKNPDDAK